MSARSVRDVWPGSANTVWPAKHVKYGLVLRASCPGTVKATPAILYPRSTDHPKGACVTLRRETTTFWPEARNWPTAPNTVSSGVWAWYTPNCLGLLALSYDRNVPRSSGLLPHVPAQNQDPGLLEAICDSAKIGGSTEVYSQGPRPPKSQTSEANE